jgi:hypothetical protein
MIERGQNLTLAQESVAHEVRVHPAFDNLDRDLPPEMLVVALSLVDVAHPAAPDHPLDVVRPDALSSQVVFGGERQGGVGDRIADEVFGGVSLKQGENFAPQVFIPVADPRQVGVAFVRRAINGCAKKRFNALPAFWIHDD